MTAETMVIARSPQFVAAAAVAVAVTVMLAPATAQRPRRAVAPAVTAPRRHVPRPLTLATALAAAAVTGWAAAGTVGALALCGLTSAAPAVRRRSQQARRRRAIEHALPEAIELLVLVVRAGRLPATAVVDIEPRVPAPVRPAFTAVAARLDAGARFADAIGALVDHLGTPAVAVTEALITADRTGLPLAATLDSLSDEARRQRRRNDDADARQLPVRLSLPLVLCTLPAFVLVAIVPLLITALSSLDFGH